MDGRKDRKERVIWKRGKRPFVPCPDKDIECEGDMDGCPEDPEYTTAEGGASGDHG